MDAFVNPRVKRKGKNLVGQVPDLILRSFRIFRLNSNSAFHGRRMGWVPSPVGPCLNRSGTVSDPFRTGSGSILEPVRTRPAFWNES